MKKIAIKIGPYVAFSVMNKEGELYDESGTVFMKRQNLFFIAGLTLFSMSSFAQIAKEEAQKASEMPKPSIEAASLGAKNRANIQLNKRKKELLKKLKNNDSPEAISNAKARLQIDRIESNRQEYMMNQEKNNPVKDEPTK